MNDPQTWTTVWEVTVGSGVGWAKGAKMGKLGQL